MNLEHTATNGKVVGLNPTGGAKFRMLTASYDASGAVGCRFESYHVL